MTPLLLAAATGQGDLVDVLVDAGGDAGAKNNNGQGILFFLKNSSQNKTVKLFLQKGRTKAGKKLMMTTCLLYTSPSPRDGLLSRMPSSA